MLQAPNPVQHWRRMSTGLRAVQAEPAGIRKGDALKVFVFEHARPALDAVLGLQGQGILLKAGKAVARRRTPFTIRTSNRHR